MKQKTHISLLLFLIVSFIVGQQKVVTVQPQNSNEAVEEKTPLSELEDTLSLDKVVHFQENFQKKYTSEEYIYEEKPLKEEKSPEKPEKEEPTEKIDFSWRWDWLDSLTPKDFATFITWLSILFLATIVGYIIYLNFSNFSFRKPKVVHRDLKDIENLSEKEIIDTSDLEQIEQLILNAEATQNYRLALRLQFLRIFKKLIDKDFIKYKKDKTNYDYYNELTSNDLKISFKKISKWYDYVWYGEYYINQSVYRKALLEFNPLLNNVF